MNPPLPFLDLVTPHIELESELLDVVRTALRSGSFIGGPALRSFEDHFAAFNGSAHCVGVASGTDAVRLALIAGGVKPGETVLTVANTFVATVEAILQAGAFPEFIDVDGRTHNMSPWALEDYLDSCAVDPDTGFPLGRRTGGPITAVLPVHLFGQMADMDAICDIAQKFRLKVFEDACQAHGAEYFSRRENRWRKAGTVGVAAAFSFYPGKNLGACGEAGAITTGDEALAAQVRMLRDHGQSTKYQHEVVGCNGRLDAIQAGFLDAKLKHLPRWTEQRRAAAALYNELLKPLSGIAAPFEPPTSKGVYHLYVVRLASRDKALARLMEAGIGAAIHYPVPVHLQNGYSGLGFRKDDLPVSEKLALEILSLPMFPHITANDQERVVRELARAIGSSQRRIPSAAALSNDYSPASAGPPEQTVIESVSNREAA